MSHGSVQKLPSWLQCRSWARAKVPGPAVIWDAQGSRYHRRPAQETWEGLDFKTQVCNVTAEYPHSCSIYCLSILWQRFLWTDMLKERTI